MAKSIDKMTHEALKEIIMKKAVDCFEFQDYLIIETAEERKIIKNIPNKKIYLDLYLDVLLKKKGKEKEQKRAYRIFTDEEELFIKLNYLDVKLCSEKLNISIQRVWSKIQNMREKGLIPQSYKKLEKMAIEGIIDNIRHSRIEINQKSNLLLTVGKNIKGGLIKNDITIQS